MTEEERLSKLIGPAEIRYPTTVEVEREEVRELLAALSRLRAEVEKLREERDEGIAEALAAVKEAADYALGYDVAGWEGHLPQWQVRDKLDVALARLEATASGEAIGLREAMRYWRERTGICEQRAEAAEAEAEKQREALRRIADTASWYANNSDRLAHEVDHALCVEILDVAERAIEAARPESADERGGA